MPRGMKAYLTNFETKRKICKLCQQEKSFDEFYMQWDISRGKRPTTYCKECQIAQTKARHKQKAETIKNLTMENELLRQRVEELERENQKLKEELLRV